MPRIMRRAFGLLVAALFLFASGPGGARADEITFETTTIAVETATGTHAFTVELALSAKQRARGLMFRESLAADRGMLFLYPGETRMTMWMKNTLIPLDMVFIRADGQVVAVRENTVPHSLEAIGPEAPALAVLELAGGAARRFAIKAGARVRHPVFSTGG